MSRACQEMKQKSRLAEHRTLAREPQQRLLNASIVVQLHRRLHVRKGLALPAEILEGKAAPEVELRAQRLGHLQ